MTLGEYLIYSARTGDLDAIKECIDEECPVDHKDGESGNAAIHMASANGHLNAVKLLIELGADINILNNAQNSALHWASLNGKLPIVKLICEMKVEHKREI